MFLFAKIKTTMPVNERDQYHILAIILFFLILFISYDDLQQRKQCDLFRSRPDHVCDSLLTENMKQQHRIVVLKDAIWSHLKHCPGRK